MNKLIPLTVFCVACPLSLTAEDSMTHLDERLYIFYDEMDDKSDIVLENNLGSMELEGAEWDAHRRVGFGYGEQKVIGENAGVVLNYGIEVDYTEYETANDTSNLNGEAIMIGPRVGVGTHISEWLFLEGAVFGGVGMSEFTYEHDTYNIDSKSDRDFAYQYGAQVHAYFAVSETVMLGARAGWAFQHLEGEFDGGAITGDTDFESDSSGVYYGIMMGIRFH